VTPESRQFPTPEEERERRGTGVRGPAEMPVDAPPEDDNERADDRVEIVAEPRDRGRGDTQAAPEP
jgi:hypothetical protein